jgi:glycosyltransferase involved in cell wall biosynthesis
MLGGLKVALVLATSAGGVGRHVRSIAAGLSARGANVVVLGPASTEEMFGFSACGARFVEVEIADRPRPVGDARAVARLRRLLAGADVVHAHGLRAGGLAALALSRPVGLLLNEGTERAPLVVTLHNAVIAGGVTGAVYGVLERVVAREADHVLVVSADLEERMRELGVTGLDLAIVPAPPPRRSPADSERLGVRVELGAQGRPLVVTVARLADQKGLSTLLDAAAGWAHRRPLPLVAIAGEGPLEASLAARISAGGLPVRLLGRRSDVAVLLAAADVVVVPSVWEGQPLVVQEALRAGRPVVATRVGGIPGLVGEAALLVPVGEPAALEGAVSRVLDDPTLAVRLAGAATRQAMRLPTESEAVEQLAGVYSGVLGVGWG